MKKASVKRTVFTVAVIAAVCFILLFPFKYVLRDGGTAVYTPMAGIYKIYDYHGHYSDNINEANYGRCTVYLFGQMVYNSAGMPILNDGTIRI